MRLKLTLLLACTLLTASAFAQTSGVCGPNLTWTFDYYSGLTISGEGEMDNFAYGEAPWYSFGPMIAGVVIDDGVTTIGDYAFSNCTYLTTIVIPNSLTSIGNYAFESCGNLATISVASDNPNYSLQEGVLFDKAQTTLICFPAGKQRDEYIKEYIIPNSVTSIGVYAFGGCTGLTSVVIGESVTSIGDDAFAFTGLTSITIPNSVTGIGHGAFFGCIGLTSVVIGESVASIGVYAFYGCTGLTSITIPNSVTIINNLAFVYCSGLASVVIGESVTSIGDNAFAHTGLKQVTVKWETPLNIAGNVFSSVDVANAKLLVPAGTADLYRTADLVWREFIIEESIELGSDVSATSAEVSWYAVENAASYTLTVYSDKAMTQVVGAYEFDANGQELRATAAGEKLVAQITGLSPETSYYYKLEAFDSTEAVIDTFQDEFTTLSAVTVIENTTNNDEVISTQYYNLQGQKITYPQQGQIYIAKELRRSGKTTVRKIVVND